MSKEAISTAILLIATVTAVSAAVAVIVPTIHSISETYTSLASNLNERIKTDISIIFTGVRSTSTDTVEVVFWVKNIGSTDIPFELVNKSDIFIYSKNYYVHIPVKNTTYVVENGDEDEYWEIGETLKFSIEISDLPNDEYVLTFVLYNGIKDSDVFSW